MLWRLGYNNCGDVHWLSYVKAVLSTASHRQPSMLTYRKAGAKLKCKGFIGEIVADIKKILLQMATDLYRTTLKNITYFSIESVSILNLTCSPIAVPSTMFA